MISRILIDVYMWSCVSKFKAYKHFNGIYITLGFTAYSDEGLEIYERRNHYNSENHSNHILQYYGIDVINSYIYVSL